MLSAKRLCCIITTSIWVASILYHSVARELRSRASFKCHIIRSAFEYLRIKARYRLRLSGQPELIAEACKKVAECPRDRTG